ncbi:hypothetical protein EDD15DRAFT_2193086 [Pisolithus albus]|nr:hypothetical protein EDD15DRAFT_2193086 [Pisolithus albus]
MAAEVGGDVPQRKSHNSYGRSLHYSAKRASGKTWKMVKNILHTMFFYDGFHTALTEDRLQNLMKVLHKQFDAFYAFWYEHAPSMPAMLDPRRPTQLPRDVSQCDPLKMLPTCLLLWEAVPQSSAFRGMASHVVHFHIKATNSDPTQALGDLLIFLVGLASVKRQRSIERLCYVLGKSSATGCLLCNASDMNFTHTLATMFMECEQEVVHDGRRLRGMCIGMEADESIMQDVVVRNCLTITIALGFRTNTKRTETQENGDGRRVAVFTQSSFLETWYNQQNMHIKQSTAENVYQKPL